ncbi:MAG: GGDEF domain-containing protein [Lachnospiraceae bacterium]
MRMGRYEDTESARNYKTEIFRHKMRNQYMIILLLLVLIGGISSFFRSPRILEIGYEGYQVIEEQFLDKNGVAFDFDNISAYTPAKNGMITAYYSVPTDLSEGMTLVFRSKNMDVVVRLNGEVVYRSQKIEAPLSTFSPGTRWNFVRIPATAQGKKLELRMKPAYEGGRTKVDHLYLGDRAEIMKKIIKDKSFAMLVSLIVIVLGVMYVVIDVCLNGRKVAEKKPRSLFYLGASAVQIAIWCLIETNILQLFVNDIRALQLWDNMLLVLGSLGMYIYMDCEYDIFKNKWLRIPILLNMVYVFVSIVLHVARIRDFHQLIGGVILQYGIIVVILLGCIIRQSVYYKNSSDHIKLYYRMQKIGVAGLLTGMVVDIVRYCLSDTLDRAFGTRIGIVIFVISFGMGNIRHLIVLAKQGENAEMMRALAYNDSLTGVENRNSFEQRLEELAEEDRQIIGIVMCDVNNLKQVNDIQGHQFGDALIRGAAEIICDSFGKVGTVYRIGGDEFCVLIERDNPVECYRQAKRDFQEKLKQYNRYYSLKISIAHGVAYCVDFSKEGIRRAQKEADEVMYENKRYIKIKEHRAMR